MVIMASHKVARFYTYRLLLSAFTPVSYLIWSCRKKSVSYQLGLQNVSSQIFAELSTDLAVFEAVQQDNLEELEAIVDVRSEAVNE